MAVSVNHKKMVPVQNRQQKWKKRDEITNIVKFFLCKKSSSPWAPVNRNLQWHIPWRGSSSTVSRSNWNLECWFFPGGRKPGESGRKTPGARMRTNNKLNQHIKPGRNRTRATLTALSPLRHPCSHKD